MFYEDQLLLFTKDHIKGTPLKKNTQKKIRQYMDETRPGNEILNKDTEFSHQNSLFTFQFSTTTGLWS